MDSRYFARKLMRIVVMHDGQLADHTGTIMPRQSHFAVTGRCGDEEHPDGSLSEEHRCHRPRSATNTLRCDHGGKCSTTE